MQSNRYFGRLAMRKNITFEIHVPKTVRVDNVEITSIPLDERWDVTVKDRERQIGRMPLAVARRKFA